MRTAFDDSFAQYTAVWESTYIAVSPVILHQLEPSVASVEQLLRLNPKLRLTIAPGDEIEELTIKTGALREIPKSQAYLQTVNLFKTALDYSGGSFHPQMVQILPGLADLFLDQFENGLVVANSSSADWSFWNSVTNQAQDMLIACIDHTRFRCLLGVAGD